MRVLVPFLIAAVLSGQAQAQEAPEPDAPFADGLSLIEEGARLVLQGIISELGPAWDELKQIFDDLNAWHPPELLPNGDIIIRRRTAPGPKGDGDQEL